MALTQVKTTGLADDAVTGAKIADDTVAEANMANDAISLTELKAGTDGQIITWDASGNPTAVGPGTDGQVLTSTGAGSPPAFEALPASNNYTHPNHSGEVTSTGDGATVIADDVVDEANLKISNAGSNGQFLSKQSGNTGGLTWATVSTDPTTTSGTNNFTVADGDLVIGTSGHGISFAATSDGGTGTPVELLDDYEEGIWAPSPDIGTCTVEHASYTKIGDIVTGFFQVSGFSNTSAVNGVSISLPFAAQGSKNGSTGFNVACGAANGKHIHSDAQSLTPTMTVNSNGTLAYFGITSDTDTWDKVRHQDLESNHVLQGFFTYKVA